MVCKRFIITNNHIFVLQKALKQKAIAQAALTGGKKREVIFDEESRVEFLTGFRKRKQERRKFGLAMQVMKEKKGLREMRKIRRTSGESLPSLDVNFIDPAIENTNAERSHQEFQVLNLSISYTCNS